MSPKDHPQWLRVLVGAAWVAVWSGLLWAVHRPWAGLGGVVGERLRWLERVALAVGLIVGWTSGHVARDGGTGARRLLYPAAAAGATLMVVLRATERSGPIGVVLNTLLAYLAGALTAYLGVGSYCRGNRGRADDP